MAAASALTCPDSPAYDRTLAPRLNKTLLARALDFSRHSFYYRPKLPSKDAELGEHIKRVYKDDDDTLGSRKLAKQIGNELNMAINHKRVARVMSTQDIQARARKPKYRYPGKTKEPFTNLVRAMDHYEVAVYPKHEQQPEIVRSDILEGRLADGSKVRVAFAWRQNTAQIFSLVIDWRMQAELIVQTLKRIPDDCLSHIQSNLNRSVIWHSDQGSQYGSEDVIDELIRLDFIASMSRAGTPTDNGHAERMVSEFKHAVLRRQSYRTMGELLTETERWINYYNERRPHGRLSYLSPNEYARLNGLGDVPKITVSTC